MTTPVEAGSLAQPPPSLADSIVIVSGLPRSGTSLLMTMLKAGGMPILTDGLRAPDPDNPNGYFEDARVKLLRTDHAWLLEARGKAVKIVVPLLFHLPETLLSRILFIERDLDEVIASQTAMLARQGIQPKLAPDILKAAFQRQLNEARQFLRGSPRRMALTLIYQHVLDNPAATATAIAGFLGADLPVSRMAAVVDLALHRQRKSVP